MALTNTQTIDLFLCLEVPYSTGYSAIDGMGAAYVQTANQPILSAAKNAILAYVAGMEAIALAELSTLLDNFNPIRDVTFDLSNGTVGNLSGLSFSAEGMRNGIKKQVQRLVPYYKYHEILAARNETELNGLNGTFTR